MTKLKLPVIQELPPVKPEPNYRVEREGADLLRGELAEDMTKRAIEQAELERVVNFGDVRALDASMVPVNVRVLIEKDPEEDGILRRVQQNALDFESEGEAVNGVTFDSAIGIYAGMEQEKPKQKKSDDTQGKIANADEDGQVDFDEGGANVATKDSGYNDKLYEGKTVGAWGSGDEDDEDGEVVSRATVGLEDEMDDDTSQVPEGMLDED